MNRSRFRFVGAGFLGGLVTGSVFWTRMQLSSRRNLFSPSVLRRVAALGYLRARPSVNTAHLLREYVAWEPRSILRDRGVRLLKRVETTLVSNGS